MTPGIRRTTAPAGLRLVTLLTLFAFGCATVRVPASTIPDIVPVRDGVAEPQVELWLESGRKVSPAESAEASAQARAALDAALSRVSAPEGDAILVVRAQGVARTPSRRADQRAAVAGLVVGAVVIVAAVVVVLVASKGKGGGSSVPRLASARPVPVPRVPPAPVRGVPHFVPRPTGHVSVDVSLGVEGPPPEGPPPEYWAPPEPPPAWSPAEAAQPWTPPADLASIPLPPPPPLDLDRRGFFEGDTLRLELVVVDRRTGAPLWTKTVDGEVDPREAPAVERMLQDALADARGWTAAGEGWARAAAP